MNFSARRWLHVGMLVAGLSACPLMGNPAHAGDPPASSSADENAVLKADADFCLLCVEKGIPEAFTTFAADDATILAPGLGAVKGKTAIRHLYEGTENVKLTWHPLKAEVARSGDLGYSYGTFEWRAPGTDGKEMITTGKYNTVWKKQADGAWRYVLDVGVRDP